MIFKKIVLATLLCSSFLTTFSHADDVTVGDLSARLDDLEKRAKGENPSGDQFATTDEVERLSNVVKVLTGRIEVLEHKLGQGLQEKHSTSTHAGGKEDSFATPAAEEPAVVPMEAGEEDADVTALLASLGSKGENPKKDAKAAAKEKTEEKREKATENAEKTSTSTLDSGSPAAQFNQAKGLLNKEQFEAAEEAFKHYLTEHPSSKEAKSARVHLGEAQLKQGKTNEAKASFAKAYQANSKGTDGARALLGLGESLGANSKDKKNACTVLKKLKADFPKNEETTGKANELIKKYKCVSGS